MTIKLGDDHQVQTKKKGIVRLGGVDIEAFFVPEFRISLLSVGQLDSHGYTTTFRSGICSIVDAKGQKILGANLEDALYILSTDGSAHISEIRMLRTAPHSHTVNMWHRRLTHLDHLDLRRLLESSGELIPMDVESVTDPTPATDPIPVTDPTPVERITDPKDVEAVTNPRWETPGLCQTCVHAKQQQHIVRTKAPRSSTPFALVHSDLCGPMKHSIGGAQYYIVYIDDRTRYAEVYFLITKTAEEILAKFQHYQTWVASGKKKFASLASGRTRRSRRFRRNLLNSDADRHGTVRPDAVRHGICLLDGAWQGIFLLDAAVSGQMASR